MRTSTAQIFCRACASPLVQASDWLHVAEEGWRVRLWCPECGFELVSSLNQADASFLSMAIESGFIYMLDALSEFQEAPGPNETGLHPFPRLLSDRIRPLRVDE